MIGHFIYQLHPLAMAGLVLTTTLIISWSCVLFCRYFVRIQSSDDVAFKIETYSDAFGIAFAILLGLVIVTSWTSYDQTDDLVRTEVNYLSDLYRLSDYLKEPEKTEMKQNIRQYVAHTIDVEWPLLPQGKYSKMGDTYFFKMFDILYSHEETNKAEERVISEMDSILTQLTEKRRLRILNAHSSLTPIMWIILITCNIIAFIILALSSQGSFFLHVTLQSFYALGVGLMLLLVIILDRPFYYGVYYGGGLSPHYLKRILYDWVEYEKKNGTEIDNDIQEVI